MLWYSGDGDVVTDRGINADVRVSPRQVRRLLGPFNTLGSTVTSLHTGTHVLSLTQTSMKLSVAALAVLACVAAITAEDLGRGKRMVGSDTAVCLSWQCLLPPSTPLLLTVAAPHPYALTAPQKIVMACFFPSHE